MNLTIFDKGDCYQPSLDVTSQFFNVEFDDHQDNHVIYNDECVIEALSDHICPTENIVINARFMGTQFDCGQIKQLFDRITDKSNDYVSLDMLDSLDHIVKDSSLTREQKNQYYRIIDSWMTTYHCQRKVTSRL